MQSSGVLCGVAALAFAILAIFIPFGIILSMVAILLATSSALMGERIFSLAAAVVALVDTFMLSPSTWTVLGVGERTRLVLLVICLIPTIIVAFRAVASSRAI